MTSPSTAPGNAGTPLLRLPLFRKLLAPPPIARHSSSPSTSPLRLTLLAVAPRSFWLSTRSKPTEPALLADYAAALAHLRSVHPEAKVVLYGHSLGGAVGLQLVEAWRRGRRKGGVDGLIVENPMPSIPTMVKALYPHKWLPYHYLGPLAFDRWDALAAMRAPLPMDGGGEVSPASRPPSLWLRSGRDEIIEEKGVREMFDEYRNGRKGEVDSVEAGGGGAEADRWVECKGALHDTAYLDARWRHEIREFVECVARDDDDARDSATMPPP